MGLGGSTQHGASAAHSPPGSAKRDEQVGLVTAVRNARMVDLSLLLIEELPTTWSTHISYQHKTFNYFTDVDDQVSPLRVTDGPYQSRWLLMDEHIGTHVDAPAHFIPELKTGLPHAAPIGSVTVEQMPLEQMTGPAVVIDIPPDLAGSAPGISPVITRDFVLEWERSNGDLGAGDIVLFRSGWDSRYVRGNAGLDYCFNAIVTKESPGWPAPDAPAMELLIERGIRCVGTDGVSMGSSDNGAAVHHTGLGAGVAFIEALAHLELLPVRGALFCFAPLKVGRATGAPGRAFALIPR